MKTSIQQFLASPLNKALEFFDKENLSYRLKEIKPPSDNYDNKLDFSSESKKRVLKISKENDSYLIIWSFQFNS